MKDIAMQLSIIIPAYNVEKYVGHCLDSIIAQNLAPQSYEVILVNDGSTDNTLSIANDYLEKLPLRIITQANAGQSVARNKGIDEARGEWLFFVDSDDSLVRDSLPKVLTFVNRGDLITFEYTNSEEDSAILCSDNAVSWKGCSGAKIFEEHNANNGPCWYIVRKSFLVNNNLRFAEGRYCEDGMFTIRLLLSCEQAVWTNAKVYCYTIHPNSTVSRRDPAHMQKMVDDFKYAIVYISELADEFRTRISSKCYERVLSRRNTYTFFLLVRILKSCLPDSQVLETLRWLKKSGYYPFCMPYGGVYKLINLILNRPYLYRLSCFAYRLINK